MTSFTVPGRPVPKARPRVAVEGRSARVYTPRKTRDYEETVGWCARPHCREPLLTPVQLVLRAFLERRGQVPDLLNITKAIEDGLNTIAYRDDVLVKSLRADMWYSPNERAEVEVRPLLRPLEEGPPSGLSVRIALPPDVPEGLRARVAALIGELQGIGAQVEIEEAS